MIRKEIKEECLSKVHRSKYTNPLDITPTKKALNPFSCHNRR